MIQSALRFNDRDTFVYAFNVSLVLIIFFLAHFVGFWFSIALVIVLAILIALFIFSMVNPQIPILVTFVAAIVGPWGSIFSSETSTVPFTIFQISLIFLLLITINPYLSKNISIQKPLRGFILFFFLIVLYTIFSLDRGRALYHVLTLGILIYYSFIVSQNFRDLRLYKLGFAIAISITAILSLISVYFTMNNPGAIIVNALNMQSKVFGRQEGLWADPNDFGIILVLPLLYLIARLFIFPEGQLSRKAIFIFTFSIILLGLLTTYSRSAWLALFVSTIYLFIYTKRLKQLALFVFMGITFMAILAQNEFVYEAIVNRIVSIFNVTHNTSNTARIILADAAISMSLDSYLLGVGYMSYPVLADAYFNPLVTQGVVESHNITLTLLAEMGLPGTIAFFATILYLFIFTKIKKNSIPFEAKIYSSVFRSYLVAVLLFFQFYPGCLHNNYLWFSIGALLALASLSNNNGQSLSKIES
jgi:O-antigen ligase